MKNVETASPTTDADHQMVRIIFRMLAERGRRIREATPALSNTEETGTTIIIGELSHEQGKKKLGL